MSCGAPTIRYGRAAGSTPPGGRVNITCGPGLELQPPDPVFCVTETIFFPSSLPQCKGNLLLIITFITTFNFIQTRLSYILGQAESGSAISHLNEI